MKERLIKSETAKLAKEKGFDIMCNDFIDSYNEENELMGYIGDSFEEKYNMAEEFIQYYLPTQSLLQKWLREVNKINIRVGSTSLTCHFPYVEKLYDDGTQMAGIPFRGNYKTYEEALEIGLQEGLKLIS